jgi:hypothetical protein
MPAQTKTTFTVVLIKPTHYDDDGYPIQWVRTVMPSNTLAALNGLLMDCAERQVLGGNVDIQIWPIDETNTRIQPAKIITEITARGGRGMIGFVGVQTNQFPRTVDLAGAFLDAGLPVMIGGFHVSGCVSMLPKLPPEIQAAGEMGISFFAGEGEDRRLDEVLRDAWAGKLKPMYDHMKDLPGLEGQPVPFLDKTTIGRTQNDYTSFDLGRGCPYQCSFCTIINVQGRKSRFRDPDDLEAIVRANAAQGVYKFFVTDDDLARNRNWEAHFDRLIALRAQGFPVKMTIQVDMLVHKIDGFIEKACQAGVERVFFGLENINPDNLLAANKRQNKITEYRGMFQEWRKHGASILAGYILGFPGDTRESILRDVEIVKNELPIDILEFFFLTPLPGSADHQQLDREGVWMDADPNKYDAAHRVTKHPKMSDADWDAAYRDAWFAFYTPDHIARIARRSCAQQKKGININEVVEFFLAYKVDGVHPLEGGIVRRKVRRDRRPGLPRESALVFYPRYWAETVVKLAEYGWRIWQANRLERQIMADPARFDYVDTATQPVEAGDLESLALFTETAGAHAALKRQKVINRAGQIATGAAAQ